jgi:hypothetical protein
MDNKELATKVINDLKTVPTLLDGLKKEVSDLFHKIILDNASAVLKFDTEEQFYDFLALILDELIVLPQPFETFDGMAIRYAIRKVVDPVLDKYAGKNWYEKVIQLVALNQLKAMDKGVVNA